MDDDEVDTQHDEEESKLKDFPSLFYELISSVQWKLGGILFILLIIIFSKQFIENVLFNIGGENWVDGDQPTNIGTIVLCLFACIGLILIDLLIKFDVL